MKKILRFTELYFDDAERLALYLSERDDEEVEIIQCQSDFFPIPPKMKEMPEIVNAFRVGTYEIAYLEKRPYEEKDAKYKNRTLHRVMLGDRLRDAREEACMTLDDIEYKTGIRAKNIENIELGRYDASIDVLGNIAEAIGCHLDFVFD